MMSGIRLSMFCNNLKSGLLIIILSISVGSLFANSGEKYLSKANMFHSDYEVDSAKFYYNKAEKYFLKTNNYKLYLDAILSHAQLNIDIGEFESSNELLSTAYKLNLENNSNDYSINLKIYATRGTIFLYENRFNESVKWLQKYINLAKQKDYKNIDLTASVYNDLASNYYFLGDYENCIILFQKSLELNKQSNNEDGIVTNLNNLGALFQAIGVYQKSILYLNEALEIDIKNGVSENIAVYLNNIGNNYLKLGQYEKAQKYFLRALNLDISSGDNNQIAIDNNNIGWTQKEYGNFEKAIEHISQSADFFKKSGNKQSYAKCLDNLGDLYRETKNYELSQKSLLEANKIFKETGHLKDEAVNLNNLGKLFFDKGNIENAKEYHLKAITLNKNLNALQGVASNYTHLGLIHLSLKEYKKALEYFQKSIITLIPEYNDDDVLSLPGGDNIPLDLELLYAIKAKAKTFQIIHSESTENINSLKSSFDNYYLALEIVDKMRISYYSQDKYSLSRKEKTTYKNAIEIAKRLYDITGDQLYFNKAWEITENSKAAYLYELIRENEAKLYANIPDTLLLREKIIKSQIFEIDRTLRKEIAKTEKNESLIDSLKASLFDKKFHELEKVKTTLETNYPEYYQLKYDNNICSIEDVRGFIGKGKSIIEYYIGDDKLFIFMINKDTLIFEEEIIDTNFFESVKDLQGYLSNMFQSEERFSGFSKSSYYLYSKLFNKISSSIDNDNLIIIPDGILGYIPFEILFTKEINPDKIYYKEAPYLINHHAISYSYSTTLLIKPSIQNLNEPEKDLLAIAPSFNMNDDLPAFLTERGEEFIDLIGSKIEVTSIIKIFKGEQYLDSIATESNFKKFASDYKILHIATHGLIDDEDPMSSKLLFYRDNDSIQDGDLYTYELFNMQLNAELAVLSACNTGYGKLEAGEGIISLARGFLYAGVPSIVMTLWSVPDGTSVVIIEKFYKYLKQGYPKNIALQQAKLDYLRNADNLKANPYFWAGFVNIGNTDAFSKREFGNWYFWFIGSVTILLVVLSFMKIRKNSGKD